MTIATANRKFVDAYIASNADWIITYDKHFKDLKQIEFPKVQICNLDEFTQII